MDESRYAAIDSWFEDAAAFPWVSLDVDNGWRLHETWMEVLMAMPEKDFARFMDASPRLVCQQGSYAVSLPAILEPPSEGGFNDDQTCPAMIFISEDLFGCPVERQRFTLAHEAAHVVLRHHDLRWQLAHPEERASAEEEADRLAQHWGFTRAHDKAKG
jgi:hypothetical protein